MFLHAAQQIEQAGGDCGPDKAGQQRQQQSAQRKPRAAQPQTERVRFAHGENSQTDRFGV